MPHVLVQLWPGKTEEQKQELSKTITEDVCRILRSTEASVSVSIREVDSKDWTEKVFAPEIAGKVNELYKKPGYAKV